MRTIVILRGETFRDSIDNQLLAFESTKKHLIDTLKSDNIKVYIVTFHKIENYVINDIFKDYDVDIIEIENSGCQTINFINTINCIPENVLLNCEGVVISRSDLCFKQHIDYSRTNKDVICFQWNLFHDYETNEIADQIHFIGGNLISSFKYYINTESIDTIWKGTLHNLYNFCIKHFGDSKINYLNYLENPNPNERICLIRGNPSVKQGNPIYNYTRFM